MTASWISDDFVNASWAASSRGVPAYSSIFRMHSFPDAFGGWVRRRGGQTSKSNSLPEDCIAAEGMEGGWGGDVDAATEFSFEVGDEASGEEGGAFGAGFDEEIEVTVWAGVASGEGAEDADSCDSVVGGDPEDGGSFGPAEVVESHGGPV